MNSKTITTRGTPNSHIINPGTIPILLSQFERITERYAFILICDINMKG